MKNYDVVIPLGEFCATAIALRDCGIRKASYPFDWNAAETDICGNCGFIGKIKMICNDFAGAFELQDLKETWSENKEHRGVINTKTGVHYFHDFEWGESVEKQYDSFYEKQTRRAKRLIENIETGDRILFVFVTRIKHFLSIDGNLGNRAVLKRIFSEFINGEVEYNFSTDSIKNYGLSAKENCGRWTNGHDVYMEIPVFTDSGVEIKFVAWPYIVEQHKVQDIDVFIGDEKIATWYWELGKDAPNQTLKIPANKIQGENLILHFHIKNPVSPQELGRGQDDRKLGMRFESVKITAVQPDQD